MAAELKDMKIVHHVTSMLQDDLGQSQHLPMTGTDGRMITDPVPPYEGKDVTLITEPRPPYDRDRWHRASTSL